MHLLRTKYINSMCLYIHYVVHTKYGITIAGLGLNRQKVLSSGSICESHLLKKVRVKVDHSLDLIKFILNNAN